MAIGGGEDQGLARQGRGRCARASSSATTRLNSVVMTRRLNDLHLEGEVVGGIGQADRAGLRVEQRQFVAPAEMDALARQLGLDAQRRLVVDQPAVDDRLAVANR